MTEQSQEKGWWTKYSESRIAEVESTILTVVKTAFKTWFVPIGTVVGNNDKIWTISLNEESPNTPLVMLHGFAAGLGFWCMNFDEIAKDRPVYAVDLLGFGRSSRPHFSNECEIAEQQWVSALEAWRKQLNLNKIILLGHSFGGYLAMAYTLKHPDRIKHLILADPWGFSEKPVSFIPNPPLWIKILRVALFPLTYFNPLSTVRAAGPFGPWLVGKMRRDIARRYEDVLENTEVISEYIYQCNSQNPTGETAFQNFLKGVGGTKMPMMNRYDQLHENIPVTVLYGEKSWVNKEPGLVLQEQRGNKCYVNVEIIPNSSHHLYSDQPKIFNKAVQDACKITDTFKDGKDMLKSSNLKENIDQQKVKIEIENNGEHKEMRVDEELEPVNEFRKQEVTAH